jgi:hypothetical protein
MATTMRTVICALIFLTSLSGYVPEGRPAEPSGNPGWEAEWERTIKAGEQEGEVSFYTRGDFRYLSDFEKKFPGIKVKVVSGRGNELLSRMMT